MNGLTELLALVQRYLDGDLGLHDFEREFFRQYADLPSPDENTFQLLEELFFAVDAVDPTVPSGHDGPFNISEERLREIARRQLAALSER